MTPGNGKLMNYKLQELQLWRRDMISEMKDLREKVETLDKKNDKGFADLNLSLKGINDFMKTYKENDLPRIDRLEKGVIGGAFLLIVTLAGLVWEIVWGHVKP